VTTRSVYVRDELYPHEAYIQLQVNRFLLGFFWNKIDFNLGHLSMGTHTDTVTLARISDSQYLARSATVPVRHRVSPACAPPLRYGSVTDAAGPCIHLASCARRGTRERPVRSQGRRISRSRTITHCPHTASFGCCLLPLMQLNNLGWIEKEPLYGLSRLKV